MLESIKKLFNVSIKKQRNFDGFTILVVDDTEVDRTLIEKTVQKLGCRVITAVDGQKGFDLAVSQRPHLILSDCNMPNMTGIEMCKNLRNHPLTKNIPIVFLTSNNTPNNIIECFDEISAESYMCKPMNPKVLLPQITEILQEHFPETKN